MALAEAMASGEVPVVADLSGGSLPIPEVTDMKDLGKALAGRGVDPRAVAPAADDDEPEMVEVPEPPVKKTVKAQEEPAEDEGEKEIVKPWARARILEREKREKQSEINDLQGRVAKLTEALETVLARQQEAMQAKEEQEEEIDPALDPAGAILSEVKKLTKRLDTLENGTRIEKTVDATTRALNIVNQPLIQQAQEDPVFVGAVEHVAQIMEKTTSKKFPNKTPAERFAIATDSINRTKLDWARDGLDPVQEMYDLAMTYGFNPEAFEASLGNEEAPAQKKVMAKKPDAKQQIQRAKEKASAVTSMGGVSGSAPRHNPAGELARARDPKEFDRVLDNLVKSGAASYNVGTPGRTPSFSELLPGKGVRV